ncbi:hypothetical protein [Duganella sp. S19_KUP01_CR8]|uniref:hypothetical protein n=1 Tax=Duganella sp. S19_KUP01_CR8 TaxID=3025502 RepID=UPI002FCDE1A7
MLSLPPRDADGNVTPHDHDGIHDTDGILRKVTEHHLVPDGKGGRRLSSLLLKISSPTTGISVDLEQLILDDGLDPQVQIMLPPPAAIGAVRFIARDFRQETLMIGFDPIYDDPIRVNPYHGQIWGDMTQGKIKRLLRQAQWFVEISDVMIPR